MRPCVAQTRPLKGDIAANVAGHQKLIDLALSHGAELIIFPELSITGYEPELAGELATDKNDSRFNPFQSIADASRATIGVGVPTRHSGDVRISLVLFRPGLPPAVYSKEYIHADEEPFFVPGSNSIGLVGPESNIALAICYEISAPEHSANAHRRGAGIYLASVAKTAAGVGQASATLADIARRYSMTVLMANCLGPCGGMECAGQSSIWNSRGELLGSLDDRHEGILMFDTVTQASTGIRI